MLQELIGFIHQYQVSNHLSPPEWILDIGCGCGAIILSLCKEYPLSQCIGIDQSPAACDLSRKNANSNSLAVHIENIQFNDDTVKSNKHHNILLLSFIVIVGIVKFQTCYSTIHSCLLYVGGRQLH